MADYYVEFPGYFSGPVELEYEAKGYLPDVQVKFSDGRKVRLFFYDSVRASQQVEAGGVLLEPNLILVRNIDRQTIELAIQEAVAQHYFDEIGLTSA